MYYLKTLHNVKLFFVAEGNEKRWSSLRDMFSRENRRQKLPPSGSGYEPMKEWELYRNMLFLSPHIAHRRQVSSCCNIFYLLLVLIQQIHIYKCYITYN